MCHTETHPRQAHRRLARVFVRPAADWPLKESQHQRDLVLPRRAATQLCIRGRKRTQPQLAASSRYPSVVQVKVNGYAHEVSISNGLEALKSIGFPMGGELLVALDLADRAKLSVDPVVDLPEQPGRIKLCGTSS